MGASLALWDWLAGSLRLPPARSPRLKYGVSGFDHDPHGPVGLVVEPAAKFLAALGRLAAPRTGQTAAGSRSLPAASPGKRSRLTPELSP